MSHGTDQAASYMLGQAEAIVSLIAWVTAILVYGMGRSIRRPEPDPIRDSGPGVS